MTSFQQLYLSDLHYEIIKNILTHFFTDLCTLSVRCLSKAYQCPTALIRKRTPADANRKRNCMSSIKHSASDKIVHKSQLSLQMNLIGNIQTLHYLNFIWKKLMSVLNIPQANVLIILISQKEYSANSSGMLENIFRRILVFIALTWLQLNSLNSISTTDSCG